MSLRHCLLFGVLLLTGCAVESPVAPSASPAVLDTTPVAFVPPAVVVVVPEPAPTVRVPGPVETPVRVVETHPFPRDCANAVNHTQCVNYWGGEDNMPAKVQEPAVKVTPNTPPAPPNPPNPPRPGGHGNHGRGGDRDRDRR